jgi:hypothetical protein
MSPSSEAVGEFVNNDEDGGAGDGSRQAASRPGGAVGNTHP